MLYFCNRRVRLDIRVDLCYTVNMEERMTKRTARQDSNYIIYEAVCPATGASYIGLTRKGTVTPAKAVAERWRRHLSRARCEQRLWPLYVYLNSGGLTMSWSHRILEIVRGRALAYARERELVKSVRPELNDQYL